MRYRRIQHEIDAVQFDPTVQPWPPGILEAAGSASRAYYCFLEDFGFDIVLPGDWIITDGEDRYVVRRSAFEKLYERVDDTKDD